MGNRQATSRLGSALGFAAVGVFILAALLAKWSPSFAQETKKAKKVPNKTTVAPRPKTTTVPTGKLDAISLVQAIDRQVQARLKEEKMPVSPLADDAEFLRRVYLDIIGVIPTQDKVVAFLDSKDPAKRAKVIDELLDNPRFGTYMAEIWAGLMVPRETNNRRLDSKPLQKWLAEHFNANKPLDKIAYDLLTSTGEQKENGAVTYFIGNNTVDKITDNVSRMFLGVQLQCAQCHNHPFVDWKQNEYWGMAAFFMKVRTTVNPQQAAKKGLSPGIFEVTNNNGKKGKKGGLPESAKIVPAKFLQGEQAQIDPKEPSRPVLAKWMTSNTNPFFARAMVNRFWYQLFGRGLVNPVDDMHEDNEASHPEMLDMLTEQFKANGYDIKYLMRAICNSETYQRGSQPVQGNEGDNGLYSHRVIRVLGPEQFFDSLVTVLGRGEFNGNQPKRKQQANPKKGPGTPRDAFLAFFRIDEGVDPLEYQAGIPQALRLMNSPQLNNVKGVVAQASQGTNSPAQVIERLTLIALSRRPTQAELERFLAVTKNAENPQNAYSDILWAMMNSSEFALNH